jgi:hypothetical protein
LSAKKLDISPSLNTVLSTYFDVSYFNTPFNIGINVFITADFFGPPHGGHHLRCTFGYAAPHASPSGNALVT